MGGGNPVGNFGDAGVLPVGRDEACTRGLGRVGKLLLYSSQVSDSTYPGPLANVIWGAVGVLSLAGFEH